MTPCFNVPVVVYFDDENILKPVPICEAHRLALGLPRRVMMIRPPTTWEVCQGREPTEYPKRERKIQREPEDTF